MTATADATPVRRRRPNKTQKIVFGKEVQLDDKGQPIEMGIGGPLQQTVSHWQARLMNAKLADKFGGRLDPQEIARCEAGVEAALAAAAAKNLEAEGEEDDDDE